MSSVATFSLGDRWWHILSTPLEISKIRQRNQRRCGDQKSSGCGFLQTLLDKKINLAGSNTFQRGLEFRRGRGKREKQVSYLFLFIAAHSSSPRTARKQEARSVTCAPLWPGGPIQDSRDHDIHSLAPWWCKLLNAEAATLTSGRRTTIIVPHLRLRDCALM